MDSRAIAAATFLLLGGCGGVVCENPASDEATTVVDERLIGFWRVDSDASGGAKAGDEKDEVMLVVGRRPGDEGTLDVLHVSLDHGAVLQSERDELRPTAIDGKALVSLRHEDKSDEWAPRKVTWSVMRYDLPDGQTLRVLAMEEKAVAEDVRAGKVPGTVQESKAPDGTVSSVHVTLSAGTEALRSYLSRRGDSAFAKDRPLVLKRLNLR